MLQNATPQEQERLAKAFGEGRKAMVTAMEGLGKGISEILNYMFNWSK